MFQRRDSRHYNSVDIVSVIIYAGFTAVYTVDMVHKKLVASQIGDFLLSFADGCSPHLGFYQMEILFFTFVATPGGVQGYVFIGL